MYMLSVENITQEDFVEYKNALIDAGCTVECLDYLRKWISIYYYVNIIYIYISIIYLQLILILKFLNISTKEYMLLLKCLIWLIHKILVIY